MAEAAITGWRRVTGGMRSLVRELATAVYVVIGGAFIGRLFFERDWSTAAVEPVLTLIAGFILGVMVKGRWWTTHLVGVFVSLLQVALALASSTEEEMPSYWALVLGTVLVSVCGVLGAELARWRERRRART